ncbi:MAG: phenylalanine--tRNA ligase subunit beta [Verrucomicrobiales bacterium]|nr:phenylalanine--tRNA ligase subunit beta [Verrucomicrobiales bacterium]
MKVTFNWLKQYVDFSWSPEELSERLTMLGLEVEGVQKLGGEFDGIVVAQVVTKEKHPNADKLTVCRVNDGHGERQIVCGAQNFKAGDKVPLILPGAALPLKPGEKEPFTIKVGKIRGVESQGMMCSPKELGMSEDAQGLLILREDGKVGQSFAEYLGRAGGDVVYDLEVTPNRPDLNSVIGIAREIAALTGNPLRIPETGIAAGALALVDATPGTSIDHYVAVRIDDPELCLRYTARIICGVKVGPSPDWMRTALEKVGIRSISNVVDVTNYVMLETGQPLHAFDYHLIAGDRPGDAGSTLVSEGVGAHAGASAARGMAGAAPSETRVLPAAARAGGSLPTIIIRRAVEDEKFTTLDGQERTLTSDTLLIADERRGIGIAGVMGGLNSEINEKTVDVLIESACFNPANIRRTSKKLDLRTDASYRFERGADVGICDYASQRAAQLILQTAGGQLVAGMVDAHPKPIEPKHIRLRHSRTNSLLGVEIPAKQQVEFLQKLGLVVIAAPVSAAPVDEAPNATTFGVPTFRADLEREIDLIEEVARLYGVERIPPTAPRGAIGANQFDAVHDEIAEARRILCALGLNEAQGQTLIASAEFRLGGAESVLLENPLSSDMDLLRPSLLPGLIHALRHNLARKNNDAALFEIGRVFSRTDDQMREERRVAIALTGRRDPLFWSGDEREAKFDIYDLKGALEDFFEQFAVRGLTYVRRPDPTLLLAESATIQLGQQSLGELGLLLPGLAKLYGLRDPALLAEVNLDLLLARRTAAKSLKALPLFPAIRRDVAMLVPAATTHETVLATVKQAKPAHLESVELFDVFRGQNVPPEQKSMAYAFTYRSPERTLTDAEVNAAHEKLLQAFRTSLRVTIREG